MGATPAKQSKGPEAVVRAMKEAWSAKLKAVAFLSNDFPDSLDDGASYLCEMAKLVSR